MNKLLRTLSGNAIHKAVILNCQGDLRAYTFGALWSASLRNNICQLALEAITFWIGFIIKQSTLTIGPNDAKCDHLCHVVGQEAAQKAKGFCNSSVLVELCHDS